MKLRTLSFACVTVAAVLLVGCTAVYKNTDACEQMMRSKLADVPVAKLPEATQDKLSIDHRGTGIYGSRVVVEASLSRMQTAAEAAASAGVAASAPAAASAAKAGSAAVAAAAASGASGTAGASATVASANPASAAKPAKPAKPVKLTKAVAAECTYTGLNLTAFRWLAPKELVQADSPASEAAH
jgi:flagellar capping protein FliD